MKKILKIVLIVLLVAFVVLQFFRPDKNSDGYESVSVFETETKPSAEVAAILKESCYDCHSNHTVYPWYSEIAPVSLWLDNHIAHGKKHFNASAWADYSVKKKEHKLKELTEMVDTREMPLQSYTWIHGNISESQRKLLLQWTGLARLQYKAQLEVSMK